MQSYFDERQYVLENLTFDYLGGRYRGRGFMTWKPEAGFQIDAFVERHGPPRPDKTEFRRLQISGPQDICSLRLKPQGARWAIAPNVRLTDHIELVAENRLSINVSRVVFGNTTPTDDGDEQWWYGSALYATDHILLPDMVETVTQVAGHKINRCISLAALRHDLPDGAFLLGRVIDQQLTEFQWRLPRSGWTRNESWCWPEAIRTALSFAAGREVPLLQRRVIRSNRSYEDFRRKSQPTVLGIFAPFGEPRPLAKDLFLRLALFLVKDGLYPKICRHILAQLAEAARQRTWQGKELLLSTILEAALRTIYQHPFTLGDHSFSVRRTLDQFRNDYLSSEWQATCAQAVRTWRLLRHRNAHPDWLVDVRDVMTQQQMDETFDAALFLCRFYGYMVLALAGFSGLRPRFPAPHREWLASFTITNTLVPDEPNAGKLE